MPWGGKTRFVDRGYASLVGLVELVRAAKLWGARCQVPGCVREVLSCWAKGEAHLCGSSGLGPLEQKWPLRQRGATEEGALLVGEDVPTHAKCAASVRDWRERLESWGDIDAPFSSGWYSIRSSWDFPFLGLLLSGTASSCDVIHYVNQCYLYITEWGNLKVF